jgi:hypothetical protein
MSILKSTNSGKHQRINQEYFYTLGYEVSHYLPGIDLLKNEKFATSLLVVINSNVVDTIHVKEETYGVFIDTIFDYELIEEYHKNKNDVQKQQQIAEKILSSCKTIKSKINKGTWWSSTQSLYTGAYKPSLMYNPYNTYTIFPTINF